ncbi:unnamed protein product, partial [Pylaiella littoralis]
ITASPAKTGLQRLCCACRRPGPSDNSTMRARRHIGAGECWDSLVEWEAAAAGTWPYRRDLLQEPLRANECICSRVDCVSELYSKFRKRRAAAAGGSSSLMETGQRALLGPYPSLPQQVIDMMAHLDVGGLVLDCCGSTRNAVCRLLTER